jgi:hypothetical protein
LHFYITDYETGTIIDESTLLERVPISPRTARNWREKGLLPYIKPPGGRRLLYHWPSVEAALLRMQTGGGE